MGIFLQGWSSSSGFVIWKPNNKENPQKEGGSFDQPVFKLVCTISRNNSAMTCCDSPIDTLQHIATQCNTLQHTSTHCNTLQHTATHCYTLQHTATHCNTLQYTATHCNTLPHTATHCSTLQHTATHCSTLQHCNTPQHNVAP